MGTRADFYIGRGKGAEWLGSIAWDGYPEGISDVILSATNPEKFRHEVTAMLRLRSSGTTPEMGWPWPWETSDTTDYAYAFDDGKVYSSCFGGNWFDPTSDEDEDGERILSNMPAEFPDMSDRKNVNFGARSGVIFVSAP